MLASGMRVGVALGGQRLGRPERMRQAPVARASSSPQVSSATAVKRAFNFSAGPAILPLDVLKQAQDELLDWHGSGMSVLEMSHRGPEFESIIAKAEKDLRTLMKIPDNYKARPARAPCLPAAWCSPRPAADQSSRAWQVLFVQGGASTQFAALPLNFAAEGATIDFVVTGSWGAKCVTALDCWPCTCGPHPAGFRAQGRRGGCQVQQGEHRSHRRAEQVHGCASRSKGNRWLGV